MTDFNPAPEPVVTDPAPAADPTAPAAPEGFVSREDFDREVQKHIKERNLWKPARQALEGLDPGSRDSILQLAQLAAAGDIDGIQEWAIGTLENVSGKPAADVIAERVLRTADTRQQQPAQQQPEYLTREQAAELARTEARREYEQVQLKAELTGIVREAGYDLSSPAGQAIVAIARGIPGESPQNALRQAIEVFRSEIVGQAAAQQQAAATAAAAPSGVPASSLPAEGMSPKDRMRLRVMGSPTR